MTFPTPDPPVTPGPTIDVHPATVDRFDDVAALLAPGNPDAPACWCLTHRLTSNEFNRLQGPERPDRLRELCRSEPAPGLLAYLDDLPVGWCSLGARTEMGRIQRSRVIPRLDPVTVWSVVCFVIRPGFRGRGIAAALLDAAVDYARQHGAPVLEGYPIDTEGHKVSASLAYVGTTSMFEKAGFTRHAVTGSQSGGKTRWVMRRTLGSGEHG